MSTEKIAVHRPTQLLQAEVWIAYVLRYGVILCGAVISFGLAGRLFHFLPRTTASHELIGALIRGGEITNYAAPSSVAQFGLGLAHWDADAIMALGLLMLIGLPVTRVGLTVVIFLLERDWVYTVITLIVFAVLVSGLVFGRAL
jgi:uncharacterized membrane protein